MRVSDSGLYAFLHVHQGRSFATFAKGRVTFLRACCEYKLVCNARKRKPCGWNVRRNRARDGSETRQGSASELNSRMRRGKAISLFLGASQRPPISSRQSIIIDYRWFKPHPATHCRARLIRDTRNSRDVRVFVRLRTRQWKRAFGLLVACMAFARGRTNCSCRKTRERI